VHRKIVTVVFSLGFILALLLYVLKAEKFHAHATKSETEKSDIKAKLEDFSIFKFKNAKLESYLTADQGDYLPPNNIEITGNIKAITFSQAKPRQLSASRMKIILVANQVEDLMNNATVEKVYLDSGIKVDIADYRLLTDAAVYFAQEQVLTGVHPVEVRSPKLHFTGSQGFRLDIDHELLNMFGHIEGAIKSNEKNGT
jgi:LPS export ABC transporter protein LptC